MAESGLEQMSMQAHDWKEGDIGRLKAYKKSFDGNGEEILVATINRRNISCIAFMFFDGEYRRHAQKFFFEDDKLDCWSHFYETGIPGEDKMGSQEPYYKDLPSDRPSMPKKCIISFEQLAERALAIADSLRVCYKVLVPAGPNYRH